MTTHTAVTPSEDRVPSPCRRQCTLDEDTQICLGCLRTLAEIKSWRSMAPADQRALLAVLDDRRRALPPGTAAAMVV